jgi:glutamate---cysteine ligase / carboxylate-amine ligase
VTAEPLGLFGGYGIELEYMIVNENDLSVFPASDSIIRHFSGTLHSEIEMGSLNWSNELVLHVIELKTAGPAPSLEALPGDFQEAVRRINRYLETIGGRLLPTAMHPWMDPLRETRLWPHEYNEVYESYNRIFGCSGHGWANLQSLHLNLPFNGDGEFGRLHSAIRLILPILPALAASSPVFDGRTNGIFDNRLEFYRNNQRKIPSLTGSVIPEPISTRADYEKKILDRLYQDIAPHDPSGIMRNEWINSRGAIARFDRNTIEIRLIDVQECPLADCAVAAGAVGAVRRLTLENPSLQRLRSGFAVKPLARILDRCIRDAENALIEDPRYLQALGVQAESPITAGELWKRLIDAVPPAFLEQTFREPLNRILTLGSLSTRILKELGGGASRTALAAVYGELADCLAEGRLFAP